MKLRSIVFIAGIVLGVGLATFCGRLASRQPVPAEFTRFHMRISSEAIFFPPFRMMEELALRRWSPGKTIVLIGGSSVFNGVGQPLDQLWSRRLQSLLGEQYVVVNLAFRGSHPTEAAGLIAEALVRKNIPLIYLTNAKPGSAPPAVGGTYSYYYWDAVAQGVLYDYAPRQQRIAGWLSGLTPEQRAKEREYRLAANLNRYFYFQELWHYIGHQHFFTTWNFLLQTEFYKPRKIFRDEEPLAPPVEVRFQNIAHEIGQVQELTRHGARLTAIGQWELEPTQEAEALNSMSNSFPPELRPHVLMVLPRNAPFYLSRMSQTEQLRDEQIFAAYQKLWIQQGIDCLVVGSDFVNEDFHDRVHLGPSGGDKTAAAIAHYILTVRKKS